jgi:predicted TIM-barrel fold metal-dependent hydrolase
MAVFFTDTEKARRFTRRSPTAKPSERLVFGVDLPATDQSSGVERFFKYATEDHV